MSAADRDDARDRTASAARAAAHRGADWTAPVFVISAAAEMTDMHPQTLRQYDRLGLVVPQRQGGRQRRYSRADVDRLRTVQALSREGVSLEGIRRIVDLQREVEQLQDTVADLAGQVDRLHQASRLARVFTVGAGGDVSTRYGDSETRTRERRAGRPAVPAPTTGTPRQRGAVVRALPTGYSRTRRVLTWTPPQD